MDLDDPNLLKALGREHWHVGSSVEIFSNTDQRWSIGCVISEEPPGVLRVLFDHHSSMKSKLLGRNDNKLAPVGTHVRQLPPYCEVAAAGGGKNVLVHRPTGRKCRTLEETWALHFDVFHRSPTSSQPHIDGTIGGVGEFWGTSTEVVPEDCRPVHLQHEASGAPTLADMEAEIRRLRESLAHSEEECQRQRLEAAETEQMLEAEIQRCTAEFARIEQLEEERGRQIEALQRDLQDVTQERDEARQELERFRTMALPAMLSRSVPSVCGTLQASDKCAPENADARHSGEVAGCNPYGYNDGLDGSWSRAVNSAAPDSERGSGSVATSTTAAVEVSLNAAADQPNISPSPSLEDGGSETPGASDGHGPVRRNTSDEGIGRLEENELVRRNRRPTSERPVEVRVSVPRALTPDELLEESMTVPPARSLRSLAQAVLRLPSAPLSAPSSAITSASMTQAGLSASATTLDHSVLVTAETARLAVAAAPPPPVCVIATTAKPVTTMGTYIPGRVPARLVARNAPKTMVGMGVMYRR